MTRADYLAQDPHTTYDRFYRINPDNGEVMPGEPTGSRIEKIPSPIRDEVNRICGHMVLTDQHRTLTVGNVRIIIIRKPLK